MGRYYYGYSGGGATDLRYQSSNYALYQEDLNDRILVAGGAGSGSHNPWRDNYTQAGDLFAATGTDGGTDMTIDSGGNVITSNVTAQVNGSGYTMGTAGDGTQTAGGAAYYGSTYWVTNNGGNAGQFGIGGDAGLGSNYQTAINGSMNLAGAGGGGYYGGGTSGTNSASKNSNNNGHRPVSGGGGSNYISQTYFDLISSTKGGGASGGSGLSYSLVSQTYAINAINAGTRGITIEMTVMLFLLFHKTTRTRTRTRT